MADSLFCTEGDILRALKYWESEKLVTLLYEEAELTGITLQHRGMKQICWLRWLLQVSVTPVRSAMCLILITYLPLNPQPSFPMLLLITHCRLTRFLPQRRSACHTFLQTTFRDETLTPDRVKELKQNEDIIQLLYIAEQYLGKNAHPHRDTQDPVFLRRAAHVCRFDRLSDRILCGT